MSEKELSSGFLIKKINEAMDKQANSALQAYDLTCVQARMLMMLYYREGGSCAVKELEKFFHVAQPTMAGNVSRLEKKQLLEAFASPSDRRVKMVRLTRAGIDRCVEAERQIREADRRLVVSLTDEERQEFERLLKKVYDTVV